jgi:hypothetical protein
MINAAAAATATATTTTTTTTTTTKHAPQHVGPRTPLLPLPRREQPRPLELLDELERDALAEVMHGVVRAEVLQARA